MYEAEITALNESLENLEAKAVKYRDKHRDERYWRDLDQSDDRAMREFYERNYTTLLNLTGVEAELIATLKELNRFNVRETSQRAKNEGGNLGLWLGGALGLAIGFTLGATFG
ncbi:MAG: hypothetical protein OEQ29_13615 [Alphaproteobacteria bacterium]|nr:hypothetical protein [Alphaproteobacteria bacterium]